MRQYVVDAFADRIFEGNPAAVCVMERWPEEDLMLKITRENNLSETAFVVKEGEEYRLRWFTPGGEIDLCGHATLAAAHIITRFVEPGVERVGFQTLSGLLTVRAEGELLSMDFPAYQLKRLEVTEEITQALGARPSEVWRARDLLCVFDRAEDVLALKPDMDKLLKVKGALMQVTAPGMEGYDCVSRSFAPKMGVPEDPVCGSGHCHIIPYWAQKLGKTRFVARQASPRGGTLYCRLEGDRVILAAVATVIGQIVAAALALTVMLAGCSSQEEAEPLPQGMDTETVLTAGEAVLDQLLEGDYEAVYESFREDIRADLTAQSVQDLVEPVFQEAGDYQELKSARVTGSTEGEEHGIAQLLCIFSQEKVSIRVAFDPDMELIGLSAGLQKSSWSLSNLVNNFTGLFRGD